LQSPMGRLSIPKGVTTYNDNDNMFLDQSLTIVGTKTIFICLHVQGFLQEVS